MKDNKKIERMNDLLEHKPGESVTDSLIKIIYDKYEREKLFGRLLREFDYDLSFDWFNEYYQIMISDRKHLKQDLTPNHIARLLCELMKTNNKDFSEVYEPATGTGSILIQDWNINKSNYLFKRTYHCEELSFSAIPFLLINLMIRGITATVLHCDVLSRKCYGGFWIFNSKNIVNGYSDFNVMPYSKDIENHFGINFVSGAYQPHIESHYIPNDELIKMISEEGWIKNK